MENTKPHTQSKINSKTPQWLYLTAAVVVILFSIAGIATFMGWIPSDLKDRPVVDKQSSAAPKTSLPSKPPLQLFEKNVETR